MNTPAVPKRIATSMMNALKGGVVPRVGLGYIAVGREGEINALLRDVEIIEEGGAAFRFIVGNYGSGKSFLLQTIKSYALDRGFVAADGDLSPERRLAGTKNQGLATYRELLGNLSTKTKPEGGALGLILEKWISGILSQTAVETGLSQKEPAFVAAAEKKIYGVVEKIESLVHGFDFARAIILYWKAVREGDDGLKANVLRWFRGEYPTKTEARRDLGLTVIITDDDWYEYIKILAVFFVEAGYKGFLVLLDELVNIYRIPNGVTRQYNYEKMLAMYNDTLQGKAKYLGILMSGTPQCLEDTRKGIFSYDALRSRLEKSRFLEEGARDLLAPVIRLSPLTYEEMLVLLEKLMAIHCGLYGYESKLGQEELIVFLKKEYGRVGAEIRITPREVIRDFIELLNVLYQNPQKTMEEVMGEKHFETAPTDSQEDDPFAEFDL